MFILDIFSLPQKIDFSINSLMISLALGALLSWGLKIHYQRWGSSLSNRVAFSKVFVFITLTTTLIISIVKSSLALSLGLVGALSIVRFRTPVKEPEELAYLFMCIAVGLGLGANQWLATVVASCMIMAITTFSQRQKNDEQSLFLALDWKKSQEVYLNELQNVMSNLMIECDLRRFDSHGECEEVVYYVNIKDSEILLKFIDKLKMDFPNIGISFLDKTKIPGI
ncbi:DUF4956 domain-containing protein [Candidatus Uabimicrobium amorphum]|uniref:DUF4956 domain-containing protein n=1 Tax=Uabimicrobium amorphum TaxID=2596890 RepID=A0A5S9IT28_UABAM|nr:DUF4956 domain-containing protein [Candidatus Uabimicrobium amorphum]BBM87040.1 DUF4956 domain-containing protein [Candidatus Uabimicrobium amorphum]